MYSTDWLGQKKLEVVEWAKDLFKQGFLILDTETSGVRGGYHEIVQIGVINNTGEVLLDMLVKPENPERLLEWSVGSKRAVDIHGLTPQMLANAPTFPMLYDQLASIVKGRQVVTYNASFDRKMIEGDCKRHELAKLPVKKYHCAMLKYAQYYGKVSSYNGEFRWQSLENACSQLHIRASQAHSALGDSLTTLEVMKRMAGI